jgi:hypothetical protein
VKRRKGIWIAGAAVVVVAMGAFAAFYRPVPYEFLRGAAIQRGASVKMGDAPGVTKRAYKATGTLDAVVTRAKAELTTEKGWEWSTPRVMDPPICKNSSTETWIAFYHSDDVPLDGPRRPVVIVARPTRFGDNFFTWIAGL